MIDKMSGLNFLSKCIFFVGVKGLLGFCSNDRPQYAPVNKSYYSRSHDSYLIQNGDHFPELTSPFVFTLFIVIAKAPEELSFDTVLNSACHKSHCNKN
jgi:hypothetical protein